MTLNGAIMQLVELSEHPMMPAIFRPAIQKVIETISELEENPEPHWIPVTERLPETGESVLICDAYGDICIGHRTRFGYYFPDFCDDKIKDVSAWAELPEPYKGVTE